MVSVVEHMMDEVSLQDEVEGTMEYRLLMAYAHRSLPASKYSALQKAMSPQRGQTAASDCKEEKANGEANGEANGTAKKEKKHKNKSWAKALTPACLRPPKPKKKYIRAPQQKAYCFVAEDPEEVEAESIVRTMEGIVQRVQLQEHENGFRVLRRASSIQHDGDDEDEIIASIVEILRITGDKINEQMTKDKTFMDRIRDLWSPDFFSRVMEGFLAETVPTSNTEEEEQTRKIALCFHATTALTALENQPMNKLLGFGIRYLKENYSPWIQSRGGWEKVMKIQTEKEEEVEVE